MRYTCLDVKSPDVNFLRKVMSGSRHDGAAYSRHPCRQSADADIVSAFPLSFSTFLENINILRQTSSRMLHIFGVLRFESFQKPVDCRLDVENKQCRKQTSVLSGFIMTGLYRDLISRERACHVSYICQCIISLTLNFAIFTIKAENMSMVYKYYEKAELPPTFYPFANTSKFHGSLCQGMLPPLPRQW